LRQPADVERAVGILCYATIGEPCGARAKSRPEDFVVEELIATPGLDATEKRGYYPLYRIEKRHIDTLHMAEELSSALKSKVSFGGLKDKRASAVQYATPTSLRASRPATVERERFTARLVGFIPSPLSRGAVIGNRFDITLRESCPEVGARIEDVVRLAEAGRIPNFYGLQRFGPSGAGTHRIGKALVTGRFEEAVRLMLLEPRARDGETARAAREALAKGKYDEGYRLLPPEQDVERLVARELSRHPQDWVRALRAVPLKVRRLYVQAYQSAIFNMTISSAVADEEDISTYRAGDNWAEVSADGLVTSRVMGVRDPAPGNPVPMVQVVGYAFRDYGSRFDRYVKEVMEGEGISPGQFYIREMQEVSSEGGFRRPHLAVRDVSWGVEGDTARIRFALGRGQYATVLLREIIKPSDPVAAGLS
jgi:tRNA pseudouridine13 synthase